MTMFARLRRVVFGAPKDVKDPHAFHKLSLVALLAWVGLGADGLSSSAYGPEEAFRQLGEHTGLAVYLALAMATTVFVISYGTFSLSNIGMSRFWIQKRKQEPTWLRHLPAHVLAAGLCLTILGITVFEKFTEGGWITLLITVGLTGVRFLIRRDYG